MGGFYAYAHHVEDEVLKLIEQFARYNNIDATQLIKDISQICEHYAYEEQEGIRYRTFGKYRNVICPEDKIIKGTYMRECVLCGTPLNLRNAQT